MLVWNLKALSDTVVCQEPNPTAQLEQEVACGMQEEI